MSALRLKGASDQILENPLPAGWRHARLDEICNPRLEKAQEGQIPYIEIGDIDISRKTYSLTSKPAVKGAIIAEAGDILISRVRPTRGAITILKESRSSVSSALSVFTPTDEVVPEYVFHALAWNSQFAEFLGERCTGTMYPTVSRDIVSSYRIPIAPRRLQSRIVAQIEKQFTRLEAGVTALRHALANLKRYRAAVLKAACEGRLVPKEGPRCFTELGKTVTFLQGLQVPVPDQRVEAVKDDVLFLRIVNYTQPDKDFRYITDPGAKYHIQKDDVVMVRYGTPGFVGRGFEGVIANNLFRVIPPTSLSKSYLFYFLKSKAVADLIRSRQKGGTMQAISFGQLKDIPISIPPLAEQTRIVAEIERRLSTVDELESVVKANLQRATRLRQSILQEAFNGRH